jgi:AAA15 family ATPase/GTPase
MEKIRISNFRKIKGTWELELAPITFLTGTNNSGKSSVLKALMILSDFSLSKNHLELSFNGNNARKHKIDRFLNAANWNNDVNQNIALEYEHKAYSIELQFMPKAKKGNAIPLRGKLAFLKMTRINDAACFEVKHDGGADYLLKVDDLFFEKGFNEKAGASNSQELEKAKEGLRFIDERINNIESS